MSVTAGEALAAVRSKVESAGSLGFPIYWQGDDTPRLDGTAFAFMVFNNDGSRLVSFGGGAGYNRYRNRATLEAYVFAPKTGANGMAPVMTKAELIASILRSFRNDTISCYGADVIPVGPGSVISPPGLQSEVSKFLCAIAEVNIEFDQIG